MTRSTISIFEKKIFLEIINEIGLFSEFKIKHYEDIDLCINNSEKDILSDDLTVLVIGK